MKAFRKIKTYITNVGFRETDIIFNDTIVGWEGESTEEIVAPQGCMVIPGFIDQHVHGAGGAESCDKDFSAFEQMAETLAKGGTTAFLATTVTQEKDELKSELSMLADYMEMNFAKGAKMLGVHMEGPFLSVKYKGAMKEHFILDPDIEIFEAFYNASKQTIKMVTIAPESKNAGVLIRYLKDKGITVSMGHTAATYLDVEAAVANGATCVTHTYNAQSPLHHREVGMLGSALLLDEIYCELIADGVHVSIPAMKLLVKNKPKDKLILITDALRAHGLPQGLSETGGLPIIITSDCARLLNGTLAGSVLPMNRMLEKLVKEVGVELETAIDYATINPAKNLNIDGRKGSIEIGKDADFTILDESFNVYMTIRGGNIIYDNRRE